MELSPLQTLYSDTGHSIKHEAAAKRAVGEAKSAGDVLVIREQDVPIKNVCVLDLMYESGRRDDMYLIVGKGNFHFSGDGEICARLKEEFGGWAGGAGLGKKGDKRAFWGCNGAATKADEILAEINR